MRLISIYPLVKVYATREEVSDSVFWASNMCERIGEILKEGYPMGLAASDLLGFTEVLEVLMVHADFDGMLCP